MTFTENHELVIVGMQALDLSQPAREFYDQWAADRLKNGKQSPEFEALTVLYACAKSTCRPPLNTDHWCDNQCAFYLALSASDRTFGNKAVIFAHMQVKRRKVRDQASFWTCWSSQRIVGGMACFAASADDLINGRVL